MHLTDIRRTLGSQASADWQKCVKEEVVLDNLEGHALLVLAEYPLMLNPPQGIQQWARTDGSLKPMTKYQLQKRYQAATVTAPCLSWKRVVLTLNRYPSASLGKPVDHEHPDAPGRRRAPLLLARRIGPALMSNR